MTKKILIVEDDKDLADLTKEFLVRNGFEVECVHGGSVCMAFLHAEAVDLILMDIMLPDMSGADIVKSIKKDRKTSEIPVVFLSGLVTEEDDVAEAGIIVDGECYSIISKPFELAHLLGTINEVLQIAL